MQLSKVEVAFPFQISKFFCTNFIKWSNKDQEVDSGESLQSKLILLSQILFMLVTPNWAEYHIIWKIELKPTRNLSTSELKVNNTDSSAADISQDCRMKFENTKFENNLLNIGLKRRSYLAILLNAHAYLLIVPYKIVINQDGSYILTSSKLRKVKNQMSQSFFF